MDVYLIGNELPWMLPRDEMVLRCLKWVGAEAVTGWRLPAC